jgi:type IV secretory pathway VirJ component
VRPLLAIALLAVSLPVEAQAPSPVHADERCSARVDITGLPLIARPSAKGGDTMAIVVSGDGGWRRIDEQLAKQLRSYGVSVVGFLSNEYFKTRRTAEESSCALERTIRYYQVSWKRQHLILIGYSRGADVLPFMASRLPAQLRGTVDVIALLGLEPTIDFRYHPSWIPFYHPKEKQYPVAPELEKLRGHRILCVYGEKEKDSLCKTIDPLLAMPVREKGAHHFAGHYAQIANAIVEAANAPE